MNLFYTNHHPDRAAKDQHDQHLRKMILETAQIIDGGTRPALANLRPRQDAEIVRIPPSHRDNAVIRAAADPIVLQWAEAHLNALLSEFAFRFGKPHAYADPAILGRLRERVALCLPHLPPGRGFRVAMADEYRQAYPLYTHDASMLVPAYRGYYRAAKLVYGASRKPCTWTRRQPPYWLRSPNFQTHAHNLNVYTVEPTHERA